MRRLTWSRIRTVSVSPVARTPAPAPALQARSPSPGLADVRSSGSFGKGRNSGHSNPRATRTPALMSAAMPSANCSMSRPVVQTLLGSSIARRAQPKFPFFTEPMSAQWMTNGIARRLDEMVAQRVASPARSQRAGWRGLALMRRFRANML